MSPQLCFLCHNKFKLLHWRLLFKIHGWIWNQLIKNVTIKLGSKVKKRQLAMHGCIITYQNFVCILDKTPCINYLSI